MTEDFIVLSCERSCISGHNDKSRATTTSMTVVGNCRYTNRVIITCKQRYCLKRRVCDLTCYRGRDAHTTPKPWTSPCLSALVHSICTCIATTIYLEYIIHRKNTVRPLVILCVRGIGGRARGSKRGRGRERGRGGGGGGGVWTLLRFPAFFM